MQKADIALQIIKAMPALVERIQSTDEQSHILSDNLGDFVGVAASSLSSMKCA